MYVCTMRGCDAARNAGNICEGRRSIDTVVFGAVATDDQSFYDHHVCFKGKFGKRVKRCYDAVVEPSVLEMDRDLLGCSDLRRHRLNIMRTLSTHMARSFSSV